VRTNLRSAPEISATPMDTSGQRMIEVSTARVETEFCGQMPHHLSSVVVAKQAQCTDTHHDQRRGLEQLQDGD